MNIFFRKCFLIILVMISNNLFAQTNLNSNNDTLSNKAGFLWEISGKGLTKKSYLFGTCHGDGYNFTKEEIFKFKGLADVFPKVDVIGFETTMGSKEKPNKALENLFYKWIRNPDPKYLMPRGVYYKRLCDSLAEFREIDKYLADKMFDTEYWKKKPSYWLSRIFLSEFVKQRAGIQMVDKVLYDEAIKTKADIIALDDDAALLSFAHRSMNFGNDLDTLSLKKQVMVLYECIHALNLRPNHPLQKLTNLYLENDFYKMESYFDKSPFQESKEDKEILVRDRNKKWVPIIEKNMANHSCLFAFGCRHMMGEYSIIKMLRDQRYTVKPVL